jgi:tetratricopeptide (TPR) repeat protein/predicted Ser/Thr protein kinase
MMSAVVSESTLGPDQTSPAGLEQTEATLPRAESGEARRGALIDRYVVLDLAGAGAMGVVLAAYDPELDRKIAVKLLKYADETAHTRLQREAQALAKLQHHNVVTVYDVGSHDGQLFMAMEFVEGKTLGRWMSELGHPHPWRAVVQVFGEAGEGLAAAHEAGLVHRDFKPENVMMSADGRVRVMDFGLARTNFDAAELAPEPASLSHSGSASALSRTLTRTGALMGTPAYMSVEQFEGKPATALSDQFSFCVALYQALYGERPFSGATLGALFEGVREGRINAAPRGSAVPPWLRKVVVRGLAAIPEQRWPSMRALLDALAADPADRRRKWMAVALAVGLLGVAVWGLSNAIGSTNVCRGFDRKLEGVWDQERRAAVETAMLATNLSYAPGTWQRVEQRLDAYAEAWAAARTEACEATQRGEQSDELLDLRMACLDRHLTHLRATVEQLAQADATAVESAVAAVDGLPQISECSDLEVLDESTSPSPEADALEQRLIAARALENLGKIEDALQLVAAVVEEAEQLDDERVRVHASQALGRLQQFAGDYEAAAATLEQTYRAAIMAGMFDEAATAARRIIVVLGGARGLARPKDGRAWALHAEVLTKAAGSEEDYAQYEIDIGELDTMDGEYASARAHYERALAIYEGLPNGQYGVIAATTRLANAVGYAADFAAARRHYERSLAILEQTLDPTHPDIGRMHLSLGDTALQEKRYTEARDSLQAALTIFEQALGPEHPLVGYTLGSLGYVEGWADNPVVARKHLERAIALLEAAVGVDHYYYAEANSKMGSVAQLAGDYAGAKEYYERARASMERTMGPDHPSVGYVLLNLGEVAVAQKDYALARTHAEAALAILQPKLAPDHPDIVLLQGILDKALRGLETQPE